MQTTQVLVADAQGAALPDLLLDLKAALLGVGILHVRIHGREVDQGARTARRRSRYSGRRALRLASGKG